MKKIVFRADGNVNTGLGHLYRLFAIVEMLKNDFEFVFLTRETSSLNSIPSDYNVKYIPAELPLHEEHLWIAEHFSTQKHLIVADGYQFDRLYQKQIKNKGYKLIYIDDLSSEYMYADIVINHSPHSAEEDYRAESYTKFALGSKYAILRPLFIKEAKQKRIIHTEINTAFVCFGGADNYDLTLKAVQALLEIKQFKKINVVLGGAYQHTDIVYLAQKNTPISICRNLTEETLIKIMKESHFGIVPASTILFELFCVKMVLLSGYYVGNQEKAYYKLKKMGLIHGADNFITITASNLKNKILSAITNNNEQLLKNQYDFFDGEQKERILKIVKSVS